MDDENDILFFVIDGVAYEARRSVFQRVGFNPVPVRDASALDRALKSGKPYRLAIVDEEITAAASIREQLDIPIILLQQKKYIDEPDLVSLPSRVDVMPADMDAYGLLFAAAISIRLFKAERDAAENLDRYRILVESSPNGVFVISDFHCVYANPAGLAMFGYDEDEFCHLSMKSVIHPDDQHIIENRSEMVSSARENHTLRLRCSRKDGRVVFTESIAVPVSFGGKRSLLVLSNDISDRLETEEKLRASEAAYRAIFETGLYGVTVIGPDFRFIHVNRALCEMIGYSEEELLAGMTSRDITYPEDIDSTIAMLERLVRGELESYQLEKRYRRKDGTVFYATVCVRSTRDEAGAFLSATASLMDITERRRAEDEARRLLKEKELVLREVHHRVKNNLAISASLLSLQAETLSDPSAKKALHEARGRLASMAFLYERIFTEGSYEGIHSVKLLGDLLAEARRSFNVEFENLGIADMEIGSKTAFPLCMILNELITNACKYGKAAREGRPLGMRFGPGPDGGCELVLEDGGPGIAPGILADIESHFGLFLMDSLAKQIDGSLVHGPGFARLVFPCAKEGE